MALYRHLQLAASLPHPEGPFNFHKRCQLSNVIQTFKIQKWGLWNGHGLHLLQYETMHWIFISEHSGCWNVTSLQWKLPAIQNINYSVSEYFVKCHVSCSRIFVSSITGDQTDLQMICPRRAHARLCSVQQSLGLKASLIDDSAIHTVIRSVLGASLLSSCWVSYPQDLADWTPA